MNSNKRTEDDSYDLLSPFLLAPGGTRLIQVQPTLRCNLRCKHCYSESGPDQRGDLSLDSLQSFLAQAGRLGYSYVGVSGGEPLLWQGLESFLDFALDHGFSTSIITNGTLLNEKKAKMLHGRAGIVAVSVDGPPEDHAEIRGSITAFPAMQRGLAVLRDAGIPFSIVFTLTRFNADRLSWLHEFASEEGAVGINVHPLCGYGAASINLANAIPDSIEFQVASWLLALLVKQRGPGGPVVTLDVVRRSRIEESCWPLLIEEDERLLTMPFADLVPSLIIEGDGRISPFIYGFPRSWSVGFLDGEPLADAADAWRSTCAAPVAAIVRSTVERLAASEAEYFDLFGEMMESASRVHAELIPNVE